jgi:TusE/DsrC/DsvC family sulfur relay protein
MRSAALFEAISQARKGEVMGYSLVGLKEKILEMYPEIAGHGISAGVEFSEEKRAYLITFKKGDKMLFTHLEKQDADGCMDGIRCVSLGLQIAQLISNFDGNAAVAPEMRILPECVPPLRTDEEGYLLNFDDWDENTAAAMARREGLAELTKEHLEILKFIRRHYAEYQYFPLVRAVCKNVHQPDGCVTERFMNPAVAWKIAGLPKPDAVVLNLLEHGEPPT